jgi:hypothetical protein
LSSPGGQRNVPIWYIIDERIMSAMRKDAVVLHPLPRVDEVSGVACTWGALIVRGGGCCTRCRVLMGRLL